MWAVLERQNVRVDTSQGDFIQIAAELLRCPTVRNECQVITIIRVRGSSGSGGTLRPCRARWARTADDSSKGDQSHDQEW